MKPSQLTELLSKTIQARLPVLIKGAPGIGKTDIVTGACKGAGAELIVSHPVVDEPIDYKGLPYIKDGCAEFLPFGALHRLIEADRPTVYFMDDLGQAPVSVQAAAMQLILARRINGHRVSEQVTFIAATNRKQDKAGVAGILEPVKSRFASIIELEPDLEDWVEWALSHGMPAELIAFIRFRPRLLFDFVPSVDITNSPCPRTVHNVAKLMALALPAELEFEAYSGAAGQGFAAELMGFLKIFRQLPDPGLILLDPHGANVPTDPATLYAVCGALARVAEPSNMDPLVTYANRLPDEFSVLLITDCERQNSAIVNTRAYAMWTARHHQVMSYPPPLKGEIPMSIDISQKAMLASLQISCWSARKHDRRVTDEVNEKYNGKDAGRFNKVLATKDSLKQIQAAVGAARSFHLEQSLPWGERGERLLPSKNYSEYNRQMRVYKQRFETAVDEFAGDYANVIFQARQSLGGLFRREDYPDASQIRGKFDFKTVIAPVPTGEDFRVSLARDEVAAIKTDIEQRLIESNAAATRDLWQRLFEVVGHMVDRLSDPDAIFRDSLVGNIIKMTELLPRLNLHDDPQLEAMRRQIEASLCQYSPAQLRCDKDIRRQAADEAQQILDSMAGYVEAAEEAA